MATYALFAEWWAHHPDVDVEEILSYERTDRNHVDPWDEAS